MKKRGLAILLAIAMLLTAVDFSAFAADRQQEGQEEIIPEELGVFQGESDNVMETQLTEDGGQTESETESETFAETSVTQLFLGTLCQDSIVSGERVFCFTPEEDRGYILSSQGTGDLYGQIFLGERDQGGLLLAEDDDGGNGLNFKIQAELTANETYYLYVGAYDDTPVEFSVLVEKKKTMQNIELSFNKEIFIEGIDVPLLNNLHIAVQYEDGSSEIRNWEHNFEGVDGTLPEFEIDGIPYEQQVLQKLKTGQHILRVIYGSVSKEISFNVQSKEDYITEELTLGQAFESEKLAAGEKKYCLFAAKEEGTYSFQAGEGTVLIVFNEAGEYQGEALDGAVSLSMTAKQKYYMILRRTEVEGQPEGPVQVQVVNGQYPSTIQVELAKAEYPFGIDAAYMQDVTIKLSYSDGQAQTVKSQNGFTDSYGNRIGIKIYAADDGSQQEIQEWPYPVGSYQMKGECITSLGKVESDPVAFRIISRKDAGISYEEVLVGENPVKAGEFDVNGMFFRAFVPKEDGIYRAFSDDGDTFGLSVFDEEENQVVPEKGAEIVWNKSHIMQLKAGKRYTLEMSGYAEAFIFHIQKIPALTGLTADLMGGNFYEGESFEDKIQLTLNYGEESEVLEYSYEDSKYGYQIQAEVKNRDTGEVVEDTWQMATGSYRAVFRCGDQEAALDFEVKAFYESLESISLGETKVISNVSGNNYLKINTKEGGGYRFICDREVSFYLGTTREDLQWMNYGNSVSLLLEPEKTYIIGIGITDEIMPESLSISVDAVEAIRSVEVVSYQKEGLFQLTHDYSSGTELQVEYMDGHTETVWMSTAKEDTIGYSYNAVLCDLEGNQVYEQIEPGKYQIKITGGGKDWGYYPFTLKTPQEGITQEIKVGNTYPYKAGRGFSWFKFTPDKDGMYLFEGMDFISVYGETLDMVGEDTDTLNLILTGGNTYYISAGGYAGDGSEKEAALKVTHGVLAKTLEIRNKKTIFPEGFGQNLLTGLEVGLTYEGSSEEQILTEGKREDSYGNKLQIQVEGESYSDTGNYHNLPLGAYTVTVSCAGKSAVYQIEVKACEDVITDILSAGNTSIQAGDHYYRFLPEADSYRFQIEGWPRMDIYDPISGQTRNYYGMRDQAVEFQPGQMYFIAIFLKTEGVNNLTLTEGKKVSGLAVAGAKTSFRHLLDTDYLKGCQITFSYADGTEAETVQYPERDSYGNSVDFRILNGSGEAVSYDSYKGLEPGNYQLEAVSGNALAKSYSITVIEEEYSQLQPGNKQQTDMGKETSAGYYLRTDKAGRYQIRLDASAEIEVHNLEKGSYFMINNADRINLNLEAGISYFVKIIDPKDAQGNPSKSLQIAVEKLENITDVSWANGAEEIVVAADFSALWQMKPGPLDVTYTDGKTVRIEMTDSTVDAYGNYIGHEFYKQGVEVTDWNQSFEAGEYLCRIVVSDANLHDYDLKVRAVPKEELAEELKTGTNSIPASQPGRKLFFYMPAHSQEYQILFDREVTVTYIDGESCVRYDTMQLNMAMQANTPAYFQVETEGEYSVRIQKSAPTELALDDITEQEYTGDEICPKVTVRDINTGTELQDTNYQVAYFENIEPGWALVVVTGIGEYEGSRAEGSFFIRKRQISRCNVVFGEIEPYKAIEIRPQAEVRDGEKTLIEETDYYLRYENNMEAGTEALLCVVGQGYYEGELIQKFTIPPRPLSEVYVGQPGYLTYSGDSQLPQIYLSYGSHTLMAEHDYVCDWQACDLINAGKKEVELSGLGNFTGKVTVPFEILPLDLNTLRWDEIPEQTYEGQPIRPAVGIYDLSGQPLQEMRDYTINYEGNTALGKADAVLEGKGNYTGRISIPFTIKAPMKEVAGLTVLSQREMFTEGIEEDYLHKLSLEVQYTDGSSEPLEGKMEDSHGHLLLAVIRSETGQEYPYPASGLSAGKYTMQLTMEGQTTQYGFEIQTLENAAAANAVSIGGNPLVCQSGIRTYAAFSVMEDAYYTFQVSGGLELYDETKARIAKDEDGNLRKELSAGTYYLAVLTETQQTEPQVLTIGKEEIWYPEQITGVSATGGIGEITLSWAISAEINTTRYRIYRRMQGEETYTLLMEISRRNQLSYSDTLVQKDKIYEYYITGLNTDRKEGPASQMVSASLIKDSESPIVKSILPQNGSRLNGKVTFRMEASDNVEVAKSSLYRMTDAEEEWQLLAEQKGSSCKGEWDTASLADGILKIKAVAWDDEGNQSNELIYTYQTDNTPPGKVTGVEGESTSVTATLRWDDLPDEDLQLFRVEQKDSKTGEFKTIEDVYHTLGANLKGLAPDTEYVYRIIACDMLGNWGEPSEEYLLRTTEDMISPVVTRILPGAGYYRGNIPVNFSLWDDVGIAGFELQVTDENGTWITKEKQTFEESKTEQNLTYELDTTQMKEGKIRVRGIVTDTAGNRSETGNQAPFVEYAIDRTAPAEPKEVEAEGKDGYIEIRWAQGREEDLNGYSIYRSLESGGNYEKIASGIQRLNYLDQAVSEDTKYFYKVTASDLAGNEGAASEVVQAVMLPDTAAPEILSVYPGNGRKLGGTSNSLAILVKDNQGIKNIKVYGRKAEDLTFAQIAEISDIGRASAHEYVEVPKEMLRHGEELEFRINAEDFSGNISEDIISQYVVDLEAPAVGNLQVVEEGNSVKLTWKGFGESDLAGYRISRKQEGSSKWSALGERGAQAENTEYTFYDNTVEKEAVSYIYLVEAVDQIGNYSENVTEAIRLEDRNVPIPVLNCENTMERGVQYLIDASASHANTELISYKIDMGDGCTSDKSSVVHTYESTGSYTITLEIEDKNGNQSVISKIVEVKEREAVGSLKVKVTDNAGNPLPNAEIYFDLGGKEQFIRTADSSGIAVISGSAGVHSVGCIKGNNEYLPAKKDVVIKAGMETEVTFVLIRQPIVEGAFDIHRMDFEEIQAAGIDIANPENQYIVKVNLTLDYGTDKMDFEFHYNPTTGENDAKPIIKDVNGEKHQFIPSVIGGGSGSAGGADFGESGEAAVAILDIPITASTLKEFFDVKLHILNHASSEFALVDNRVSLNLPAGLSVAETTSGSEKTETAVVDSIPGGTTKTIQWILRGDQVGEYKISADYSGTLSQFDRLVTARFEASEPIKVHGLTGLAMTVHLAKELKKGQLYYDVDLENKGEIPVYKPSIDVQDMLIEMELFEKGASHGTGITDFPETLAVGQKLIQHYACAADSTLTIEDKNAKLKQYFAEVEQTYGLQIQIVTEELDYFRAADDVFTIRFDSQGGSAVDSITGIKAKESIKLPSDPKKDGYNFGGWFDKLNGKGSLLTARTQITRSMTYYAYWTTERGSATTTVTKISGNQYGIHVIDSLGNPIEGAEVAYGKDSVKTDQDGDAILTKMVVETPTLTVKKKGFRTHKEEEYEKSKTGIDVVTLYGSKEADYKLTEVYCYGMPKVNLLKNTKRYIENSQSTFRIEFQPLEGLENIRYELWQNTEKIADAKDHRFTELRPSMFAVGKGVHIRVYYDSSNPNLCVKTKLNLEIVKSPQAKASLEISDDIGVDVPESVPFIGGSTFTLDTPSLPIEFLVDISEEDVTCHIGINVGKDILGDKMKRDNLENFLANIDYAKAYGGMSLTSIKEKINAYQKTRHKWGVGNFSAGVDFNAVGYVEATVGTDGLFKSAEGYISVALEGYANYGWTTVVVVVPVVVDVSGKLVFDFNGAISYDYDMNQLLGNLKLDVTIGMEIFGGIGISGILAGGGFGSGELKIETQLGSLNGIEPGINQVDLTGEVGLKAYAGPLEYKRAWLHNTWNIYTKGKGASKSINEDENGEQDLYNIENYSAINRDYLKDQSQWQGEEIEVRDAKDNKIQPLIQNTYGAAKPEVVTTNDGTAVMAFIRDDGTRDAANVGQLVYSVWGDGSWSQPEPVDNNGRADAAFRLYTDGNEIYLLYQEANIIYPEDVLKDGMDSYVQELGITGARFNKGLGAFERTESLTAEDKVYRTMPRMILAEGKTISLWVENAQNEYFNTNASNKIVYRINNGAAWEKPVVLTEGQNCITSIETGSLNGTLAVAYITDEDNDLSTTGDRRLYLQKLEGNEEPRLVAKGELDVLRFQNIPTAKSMVLTWYSNSGIAALDSMEGKVSEVVDGTKLQVGREYRILEDRIFYTAGSGNDNSNIYCSRYKADGTWSAPVMMTNQSDYLQDLQVVQLNGKTYAVLMKNHVEITNADMKNSYTLGWICLDEVHDLVITGTDFAMAQAVAGEILPVETELENRGSNPIEKVKYRVVDLTGQIVLEEITECEIVSGGSAKLHLSIPMGENMEEGSYTITVWEVKGDQIFEETDDVDNTAQISVASTDLKVTTQLYTTGSDNILSVNVRNMGQTASGGMLHLKNQTTGQELKRIDVNELQPGDEESFQIDLGEECFSKLGDSEALSVVLAASVNDYANQNNISTVLVSRKFRTVYYVNGSVLNTDSYDAGELLELPTAPESNEIFEGWYLMTESGEERLESGREVTSDMDITAKFQDAVWEAVSSDGTITRYGSWEKLMEAMARQKFTHITAIRDTEIEGMAVISEEMTLSIEENTRVTIGDAAALTINGSLLNKGTLAINGSLSNDGTVVNDGQMQIQGSLKNAGDLTNNGTCINAGIVENPGTIYSNGVLDCISGTIDGIGTVYTAEGSSITGEGNIHCDISDHVHIYAEEYTVDVAADCKKEGEESRHCITKGCEAKVDSRKIEKLPHTPGEWKVEKEPTETEVGRKGTVCRVCGDRMTEEIPALSYKEFENVKVQGYSSTFDGQYHGITISGVPAGAKVTYSTSEDGSYTATPLVYKNEGTYRIYCQVELKGYRTYRNSETVTITACTHRFGNWRTDKNPTVLEEGIRSRTCQICGSKETEAIKKLTPVLKLNTTSIPLKVKQSTTAIKVKEMAEGDSIASWKSANKKIATVTSRGKITGKKVGKTKITITLKSGKKASVTVKVQKTSVKTTKLKISKKSLRLKKGKKFTIAAEVLPFTTSQKITFTSSNKKIATVSSRGVVKGKKPGRVKITVKSGKKKVTCKITVTK